VLPFALLESKLAPPELRAESVPRTTLLHRVRAGREARVVVVTAPAGYGKTTFLAQLARRDSRPVGWVSLDHRDNDPVVLFAYVADALDRAQGIDPAVFEAVAGAGRSIWTSALPRLCSAVASLREPTLLVLDDVHELVEEDCLDGVSALAASVPSGSQLVLAGRTPSRLRLGPLQVGGERLEIEATDLALDDAEALALLTRAGATVTGTDAQALNRHAEGWAAGLYLAALLDRSAGEDPLLARFAGNDRLVADYLRTELLARLPPRTLRFLMRTSVLDRMSGALCDAVLERHDSARVLESLERDNLFVVALDRRRDWYRYHHLFRELLRSELERREPGRVGELNRRAADWCAANAEPEAAIEHARAAGDLDHVASLVMALGFPYYRSGRVATLERWFDVFDEPGALERYFGVAVLGTYVHALRGRVDAANRWAEAVERASYEGPLPDGSPPSAWKAVVRALLCPQGCERMRVDAEIALAGLTESSPFAPPATLFAGVGAMLCGDSARAEELFREAAERAAVSGAIYVGVVASSQLALLALSRDQLAAAEEWIADGWSLADGASPGDYVPVAILLAASARLAMRRGDTALARTYVTRVQPLRPLLTHSVSWFAVQTNLELARVHLGLADAAGARTLLREARDILVLRPGLGTVAEELDEVARHLSALVDPAAGWASTLTAAELRLLPLLTTHLTFREIAERLHVSRNTVKTQAISVYRKLDASSRSEAIERAAELGLVDASVGAG
jgi:LuxR family maltose regulon positive regulatory protein